MIKEKDFSPNVYKFKNFTMEHVENNNVFNSYIKTDRFKQIYDKTLWAEGPCYIPHKDMLVWSDNPNNRMMKLINGQVSEFRNPSNFCNGNTIDNDENFDIEVFEIDDSSGKQELERKRFAKNNKRIDGGFITQEYLDNYNNLDTDFTTDDVEYYFEIRKDQSADHKVACKGAEIFNKQSYYIDLDFDCYNEQTPENYYFDIYGPVTEPEICL